MGDRLTTIVANREPKGWTVDTLNAHLTAQLLLTQQLLQQDIERLRESIKRQSLSMIALMDERYVTQTRATEAAFTSAERATSKVEESTTHRFESVNEFRRALSDQTATFLPRSEYNTLHHALEERVDAYYKQMAALELRLTSRLDLGQGANQGQAEHRMASRLDMGQLIAIAMMIVVAIGVLVNIFHK